MAFGGYKFAGFRVDNSQYADVANRCLAIHVARVRAFLKASSMASSTWLADIEKKTGELDLNIDTGVLTNGVNNGVIHEFKVNNVTKAYSSYFKYSSGDVAGYYYILTMVDYGIGDSTDSGYIKLNKNTCLQRYGTSYQSSGSYYYYGPRKASCFHCLSSDPFPSSLSPADLDLASMKATKLCSIGANCLGNTTQSYMSGGYVNRNDIISLLGYVIKDTDIISFAGYGDISSYTNPFSAGTGGQISVLSLNGFSELYNPDDIYKLLQYDARNYSDYSSDLSYVYDETYVRSDHPQRGAADQVQDPQSGAPLVDTEAAHTIQVYILSDARTYYNPSGAQTTPYSGLQLCLYDNAYSGRKQVPFSNSTQYIKGSTNPELLAMNVSYSLLSYTSYSPSIDGNLLFINSAYANSCCAKLQPSYWQMTSTGNPNLGTAYYNFFIGWDASNPDIKSDLAWPEYNATIPS